MRQIHKHNNHGTFIGFPIVYGERKKSHEPSDSIPSSVVFSVGLAPLSRKVVQRHAAAPCPYSIAGLDERALLSRDFSATPL